MQQSGPPLPKIYVSEGVSVNETPEMTTFWGGCPVFWGGGGSKGPSLKAPTFPRVGTPKCRSRCGMASRFGVYVSDTTFRNVTFPRSTFRRQLSIQIMPRKLADIILDGRKCTSDPHPPHTRQKYEQTSEQNMTPNALKQGKFGSLGAIFLFICLPCMWGLGLQKNNPHRWAKMRVLKTNKRISKRAFQERYRVEGFFQILSGPLNRLNAILCLLHPLDRYRTPSAIGSAIGRPLSRPISHPNTGGSPQPPRSKPLGGLNRAIVVL